MEISWSPPTDKRAFNITGYRIFYGIGQNNIISVPSVITSVSLMVNDNYDGQTVYLRSESDQLFSEDINVTVHMGKFFFVETLILFTLSGFCLAHDMGKYPCNCSREVGATAGVMTLIAIIAVIVFVISYWWR